jgi:hypothetical protein
MGRLGGVGPPFHQGPEKYAGPKNPCLTFKILCPFKSDRRRSGIAGHFSGLASTLSALASGSHFLSNVRDHQKPSLNSEFSD